MSHPSCWFHPPTISSSLSNPRVLNTLAVSTFICKNLGEILCMSLICRILGWGEGVPQRARSLDWPPPRKVTCKQRDGRSNKERARCH